MPTNLHDLSYVYIARAEARAPHPPTRMLSGNSRGPVKMWICSMPKCNATEYTYSSHETPTCFGGMKWSFTTKTPYDPRIHSEKALDW